MNILEAYDLTGSFRDAGELAGCSHHTVARYVRAREEGRLVPGASAPRPGVIDEFLPKLEELVERSKGRVRADVVHEKITAMGFAGSERTTRRAVARLKKSWHSAGGGCSARGCVDCTSARQVIIRRTRGDSGGYGPCPWLNQMTFPGISGRSSCRRRDRWPRPAIRGSRTA